MKLPNLGTMALIAFLLAAYFLASYLAELSDALASTPKQEAGQHGADALHSRDFAARQVCDGRAFEWQGDVLTCYREAP
jgi:hypothetical protein